MKVDMVKRLFVKLRVRNFVLNLLSLADRTFMVLSLNTGGTTYIALASLSLAPSSAENDPLTLMEKAQTIRWLVSNQAAVNSNDVSSGGFSGRTGKIADSCYCFWCGAALKVNLENWTCILTHKNDQILKQDHLIDTKAFSLFLSKCQFKYGGISKCQGEHSGIPILSCTGDRQLRSCIQTHIIRIFRLRRSACILHPIYQLKKNLSPGNFLYLIHCSTLVWKQQSGRRSISPSKDNE